MGTVLNMPFNAAQIELMQLLANDLETEELNELRKVLIAFRFRLVEERAERIATTKGWSETDINNMSNDHHFKPLKKLPFPILQIVNEDEFRLIFEEKFAL